LEINSFDSATQHSGAAANLASMEWDLQGLIGRKCPYESFSTNHCWATMPVMLGILAEFKDGRLNKARRKRIGGGGNSCQDYLTN